LVRFTHPAEADIEARKSLNGHSSFILSKSELEYISDEKIIPDSTWTYLHSISPIKLLVLDALNQTGLYSHCGLSEALQVVDRLQPIQALLTGMAYGLGDHDAVCAKIAKTHPHVSLAYDGLLINDFQM
jgi:hypothetical protein